MGIKKFTYRKPPTADGLKAIEKGKLTWFDPEMFSNFNTGVMEEYFEEKNRIGGFEKSLFFWRKVALGIIIGMCFAVINQYIGLKIGLVVGGSWYIMYLIGLIMRWKPTEINICSGGATGTDRTCTGFVFTFPAIFLLAYSADYALEGGVQPIAHTPLLDNILPMAIVASMLASIMGMMYFIIFRRIWLVEDPLPCPGFEAHVKLMDISNDVTSGAAARAKRSIKFVGFSLIGVLGLTFLRDFPVLTRKGEHLSVIDWTLHGTAFSKYYKMGTFKLDVAPINEFTIIGYSLTGIGLAIGWFLRSRAAILVGIGTLITWVLIVPMVMIMDIPVYVPAIDAYVLPSLFNQDGVIYEQLRGAYSVGSGPDAANKGVAKLIAIGAILGGGTTALLKMSPTFFTVFKDMGKTRGEGGKEKREYVPGKGWYEWPTQHIKIMMAVCFIAVSIVFIIGGCPPIHSFFFGATLVLVTFVLGGIAVKVSGEIGTTPVSGTSFICLTILVFIFSVLTFLLSFTNIKFLQFDNRSDLFLMALIGTTVFGSAISLSSEITWDFKNGLYAGTRPMHLIKSESVGVIFGTLAAATGAVFFSTQLAKGTLDLEAPQAHAFAAFTLVLMGGKVLVWVFIVGIMIGIFAELMTGMGTAFGLGMYLPLHYTLMLMTGGVARDLWDKLWLTPKAKKNNWSERQKTMVTLDTYMVATGLLVGEALIGTAMAIYMVLFL
jgi:uncharacterized oligopeptide transporter (OPT) family protein